MPTFKVGRRREELVKWFNNDTSFGFVAPAVPLKTLSIIPKPEGTAFASVKED